MKKKKFGALKSVQDFKKSIKRTRLFIKSVDSVFVATETFLEATGAKKRPKYKDFKKLLEFDKSKKEYLFELGFIALFSNFEFFMRDLLKDLFSKHQGTLRSAKLISYEEICDFKDVGDIKKYLIDLLSTEKSHDIGDWADCLDKTFVIKVFKNKKQLDSILMLNALRNAFMHGAGKTNSRFIKEMKPFIRSKIPLDQKIGLDREKFFGILYGALNLVIKNIENS